MTAAGSRGRVVAALLLLAASVGVVFWLGADSKTTGAGGARDLGPPPENGATAKVTAASECRACHPEVFAEWEASHHGIAYVNPEVQRLSKGFKDRDCLPCHAPLPVMETGLGERVLERAVRLEDGVDCASCHRFKGATMARTSLPKGSTAPCNPMPYAGIADLRLCASCHNLHKVVEDWKETEFAVAGPKFRDCAGCHMPDATRAANGGAAAYTGRSHRFKGAHDPAVLKSGATLEAKLESGGVLDIEVRNGGTGHNFPADERHRAVDLSVRVERASGPAAFVRIDRYRNPYREDFDLKNPLRTPGAERDYSAPLGDGSSVEIHAVRVASAFKPQRTVYFPESTQIPSGEARRYRVRLPADARRASVRLLYKLNPFMADEDAVLLHETDVDVP